MSDQGQILIIRETILQAVVSDLITFVTVVGIIGVGKYLNSEAMEWCGFVMLVAIAFARLIGTNGSSKWQSPQAAADFLLREYGVTAKVQP